MARSRRFRGFMRPALAGSLTILAGMMGCLNRPLEPNEPRITSTVQERLPQSKITKIDLLLVIDNSASMGDKQAILALAVPDLVRGLVNPLCIDDTGAPVATQPLLPTDPCPGKSFRDFDPVTDIHVGLLSSSLGSRGANTCVPVSSAAISVSNDDHGHLLARSDPSKGSTLAGQDIPTYANQGVPVRREPQAQDGERRRRGRMVLHRRGLDPARRRSLAGHLVPSDRAAQAPLRRSGRAPRQHDAVHHLLGPVAPGGALPVILGHPRKQRAGEAALPPRRHERHGSAVVTTVDMGVPRWSELVKQLG